MKVRVSLKGQGSDVPALWPPFCAPNGRRAFHRPGPEHRQETRAGHAWGIGLRKHPGDGATFAFRLPRAMLPH